MTPCGGDGGLAGQQIVEEYVHTAPSFDAGHGFRVVINVHFTRTLAGYRVTAKDHSIFTMPSVL